MVLVWLLVIPMAGGVLAWVLSRWGDQWPRWVSLAASTLQLAVALGIWVKTGGEASGSGPWLIDFNVPWVPAVGIRFHLAMDGLSLLLIVLTAFLGIMAVACSWNDI